MQPPGRFSALRQTPDSTLLLLLLLLSLCSQHCLADDPPFNFKGPADSFQSDEPPAFEFTGDQLLVSLRPKSGHQLNDSFFEPRSSMDMHFLQFEDKKSPALLQTTIEHEDHDYVNLESIEPFLVEPVTCRMARFGEKTDLDLHFQTREAFDMAKEHWTPRFTNTSARDILFVVEGPYCFEAAGTRSVYHSTGIYFEADRMLVVIETEPLHAKSYWESGWAHSMTVTSLQHQPEDHHIVPRASLDITHDSNALKKRGIGTNFHLNGLDLKVSKNVDKDLGYRHDFIGEKPNWYNGPHLSLVCLECHMKGGFAAGFTMKVELNPFHGQKGCDKKNSPRKRSPAATAFLDEHEDIQPLIYAVMEAERIKAHQQVVRKVHKLRKRGLSLPKLDHPKCSPEDPTYPVCHEKQIPRALLDADPCNPLLHPVKAAASGLKCALKSIFSLGINGKRCRRKAKEAMKEFKGLKDYAKQFIKAHVSDMEIFFEVVEEIDVKFQLELAGTVALTFWFDLDFLQQEFKVFDGKCTPIPEAPLFCWQPALPIKPSFGWFFSLDGGSPTGPVPLSGLPSGSKDDKGKHVSIGSKMGSAKSSRDASVDSKKDGPGSVTEDPSGDAMHGLPVPTLDITPVGLSMSLAMEAHMNVTLPGFQVTMPQGKLVWKPLLENKADRLENSITMKTTYLPAKLEVTNPKLTFRSSVGPRWKFHLLPFPETGGIKSVASMAGISDPLALGGHFQPIRMDHILSIAPEGDADCSNGTVKYEVLIRTGMDAYVMVFFQRVVDLSWISPLQKSSIPSESIRGLWYSKRVFYHCLDTQINQTHVNEKMNKKLLELQEPLIEAFEKIGEKISAKADHGFEEQEGLQNWKDDSSMEFMDFLEYASWQNRVGPGMKWKDCEEGVHPGCGGDYQYQIAVDSPAVGAPEGWGSFRGPHESTDGDDGQKGKSKLEEWRDMINSEWEKDGEEQAEDGDDGQKMENLSEKWRDMINSEWEKDGEEQAEDVDEGKSLSEKWQDMVNSEWEKDGDEKAEEVNEGKSKLEEWRDRIRTGGFEDDAKEAESDDQEKSGGWERIFGSHALVFDADGAVEAVTDADNGGSDTMLFAAGKSGAVDQSQSEAELMEIYAGMDWKLDEDDDDDEDDDEDDEGRKYGVWVDLGESPDA